MAELTAKQKLENLFRALDEIDEDEIDIESMTDEEVDAYLIAEGVDLDKLKERFDKFLADLKAGKLPDRVATP